MTNFNIDFIEEKIGYKFKNPSLLKQAFIHSSYAHEMKDMSLCYERLEFLGDAILEMVTSLYLFNEFPNDREGILTKTRARLVCTSSLSSILKELDISQFIMLGKGELSQDINNRYSILEDVMEAIIGALYLDGGFDIAENFIKKYIISENNFRFRDYKSEVQELLQAQNIKNIKYEIIDEKGPEHNKEFYCVLKGNDEILSYGRGKSKKLANQDAAKKYIETM